MKTYLKIFAQKYLKGNLKDDSICQSHAKPDSRLVIFICYYFLIFKTLGSKLNKVYNQKAKLTPYKNKTKTHIKQFIISI